MMALDIRSNISTGDGTWGEPASGRCSQCVLNPPELRVEERGPRARAGGHRMGRLAEGGGAGTEAEEQQPQK